MQHIKSFLRKRSNQRKIKGLIALMLLLWFWFSLPDQLFNAPSSFVITDKAGNLLNAAIAADGQWRFPYNAAVPEKFKQCIITFEDKRFNYHPGIDPLAMARSMLQNIRNKKVVSGGSTLTMQVARMSKQNSNRSWWNKLNETILAVRMECSYSKQSILALYASNAPFGSNVVGLDAAAWRYYGRSAQQLSWGECAALAVLPNAPSLVHPGKNADVLLRKRNALLNRLLTDKIIDSTTCYLAKLEPLPGAPKALPQLAPHLLDRFKKEYASLHRYEAVNSTGIQTTIDNTVQQQVNTILALHHGQLKGNGVRNAAAMVVEIESGNILAYVGNIYQPDDSALESNVDVLAAPRSPGSTLKPLLYAALLTEGSLLPRQLVPDIPTQIGSYAPQNYDLGYDGAVPANRALARSLNIPAVKMLQQYKYQRFYDVLKQCGFTTLNRPADNYGMSLILGGCEVTPYDLAGVYSSLARMYLHQTANREQWNSGDWFMPGYIKTESGNPSTVRHPPATDDRQPLFDYPAIWHTFNAMNEVMRPGEEGLWSYFSSAQHIAWKTGTSFGFRDGWAIGLTPKYCVAVWVGNTTGEGRPGLTGINTAAPILFDIFRGLPSSSWFKPPQGGFIYLPVCAESGYKAGPDCTHADTILVSESAKNAVICPYHHIVHLDKTGTYQVTANCEEPSQMQHRSWFILPPTIEYYYRQKHAAYKPLPPFVQGCFESSSKTLDLIYPEEAAKIYVPLEVSGKRGRTVFTATHRGNGYKIFWHLDEQYIGTTQQFHQMAVSPEPGTHSITIVDEQGETVTRHFEILDKEKNK